MSEYADYIVTEVKRAKTMRPSFDIRNYPLSDKTSSIWGCEMTTYQLNVKLQVDSPSPSTNAKDIGDKWHTVLCDIIEDALEADHVTVFVEEQTLAVTVDRLYVPRWIDLDAFSYIKALVREKCDGGDGEFDEPADIILRRMYDRNTIKEWEADRITHLGHFIVFENVRIVFKTKEQKCCH